MRKYYEGNINIISKLILKVVSSNVAFLKQAEKEKPEKLPLMIKAMHKPHTQQHQGFEFHTINEQSKNHLHILYFHGGGLCLNGGLAHWMMIDKWVKKTDAKASYVIYPLIPNYQISDIYEHSFSIYQHILSLYPDDQVIMIGDSAGGSVILAILQLIKANQVKKPISNILLSPWIDFKLTNPDIFLYQDKDKILSLSRFEGLHLYNNIDEQSKIVSFLDYTYDEPIDIYCGTDDILYPDILLFEQKNPHVKLQVFYNCPHVFMLLPMKQSNMVHNDIIKAINVFV